MSRSGTVIGVLIGDGAPMLEIAVAPRVFGVAGFEVRTAGERPGPLTTTAGIAITAPHPSTRSTRPAS
ncbi:type 1 glutamine amidotransferase family protein [Dactylosporangium darangshiense]|uniref:hypothetical protein n=1 Tax=Dactylosporangium darangshiense TaxID=579108 RepID=UPI0036309CA4